MKVVCDSLRVARSHVNQRLHRPEQWVDGRTLRKCAADDDLIQEIRQHIADLSSYGCRRAYSLINRDRRAQGRPVVNAKRAYRVMAQAHLLLPKHPV